MRWNAKLKSTVKKIQKLILCKSLSINIFDFINREGLTLEDAIEKCIEDGEDCFELCDDKNEEKLAILKP